MLEVELSPIDLGDVGKHGHGVAAVFIDQSCEVTEQSVFIEVLKSGGYVSVRGRF